MCNAVRRSHGIALAPNERFTVTRTIFRVLRICSIINGYTIGGRNCMDRFIVCIPARNETSRSLLMLLRIVTVVCGPVNLAYLAESRTLVLPERSLHPRIPTYSAPPSPAFVRLPHHFCAFHGSRRRLAIVKASVENMWCVEN